MENKNRLLYIYSSKYMQGKYKRYFLLYLTGFIFIVTVDVLQLQIPLIIGAAIDGLSIGSVNLRQVVTNIVLLGLGINFGRLIWRGAINYASTSIEYEIRNDLFGHLLLLSQNFYSKNKTGDIMAHMINDLNAVRMAVSMGTIMSFDSIIFAVLTINKMVSNVDLSLSVFSVLPLSLIFVTSFILSRIVHERFRERQEAFSDLSDFTQESFSGINILKAFVQESKQIIAFRNINRNNFVKNMRTLIIHSFAFPMMGLISALSLTVILGYGGYLAVINRISTGQFIAFIQFLGMLVFPMMALGFTLNVLTRGAASLKRIENVLNKKVEIKDGDHTDFSIKSLPQEIMIKNLTFTYPDSFRPALKDVSLIIKPGETLGILGRTGSGKSTLVNLLLRMYDPPEKTVFFGEKDIMEIPLSTLRKSIGYVPQDNFLFSNTIAGNISFGTSDTNLDSIVDSAEAAAIHSNIIEFNKGYDTIVGERGVNLSGGQKQRIAIARALIKNPEILILDDSVSAVDTKTEEEILKNLRRERENKTNIVIAHRVSTLKTSDNIIVIDEGSIIEQGNHEQLLEKNGLYKEIYEKQLLEEALERDSSDGGEIIE